MSIGNGNGERSERPPADARAPTLEARMERLETKMSSGFLLMAGHINEVAALVRKLIEGMAK